MTEHRGEGHRHGQGGEQGDDVGGAEGLQEPPFHPRQEEQGRNTRRMMSVAKTIDARISTLAA